MSAASERTHVQRSLAEELEVALRQKGYSALRAVQLAIRGSMVVLRGTVPSYYLKQVAQATVLAHPEVETVQNELVVVSSR